MAKKKDNKKRRRIILQGTLWIAWSEVKRIKPENTTIREAVALTAVAMTGNLFNRKGKQE